MPAPIYRGQLNRPMTCAEFDQNILACLDRTNHTGVQPASSISDFNAAVTANTTVQTLQTCCNTLTTQVTQLQQDIFGEGQLSTLLATYTAGLQTQINTLTTTTATLQTGLNTTNSNVTNLQNSFSTLNTFSQGLSNQLNLLKRPASVIFVDAVNGNDTNNGLTAGTALRTLGRAAEYIGTKIQASDGIEIRLAAGTYDGAWFTGRIDGQSNRFNEATEGKFKHILYITGDTNNPANVIINHKFYASYTYAGIQATPNLYAGMGLAFANQWAIVQGITFEFNASKIPAGGYVQDAYSVLSGLQSWVYVDKCVFKPIANSSTIWGHQLYGDRPSIQYSNPGAVTYGIHMQAYDASYLYFKDITVDGNNANGFNATCLLRLGGSSVSTSDDGTISLTNSPRFGNIFEILERSTLVNTWRTNLARFSFRFTGNFGARTGQTTLHASQGGTSSSIPTTEVNRTFSLSGIYAALYFPLEDGTYTIWPSSAANVTKTALWPLNLSGNVTNAYYAWIDTRPGGTPANTVVNV